jgi:hypothetical protein
MPDRDDARAQGRVASRHLHLNLVVHFGLFLDDKHDDFKAQHAVIAERACIAVDLERVVLGVASDLLEVREHGGLDDLDQVNVASERAVGADAVQLEDFGAVAGRVDE